jgi:hypothetical protein
MDGGRTGYAQSNCQLEIIPVLYGKKLYRVSEIECFFTIPVTLLSLTEALPYGCVTELDC